VTGGRSGALNRTNATEAAVAAAVVVGNKVRLVAIKSPCDLVTQRASAAPRPHATMSDYWIHDSIKDKPFEDFYELGRELGK